MQKYKIQIIPPKIKNMMGNCKLIVRIGKNEEIYKIEEHMTNFCFEIPDGLNWGFKDNKINTFELELIYSNKTKEQVIIPVPMKEII